MNVNYSRWMAGIDDETYVSEISLPGTHNSAACFKIAAPSVQCQGKGILEQLQHGVRFLDIRLSKDYMSRGEHVNDLMVVHGKFPVRLTGSYKFKKVLNDLYKFLESNPTETVMVSVKFENTMLNWNPKTDEFAKVLFQKYIAHHRDRWYLSDKIPTLKYARGKALLLRRFSVLEHGVYKRFGIPFLWNLSNPTHDGDSICVQDFCDIKCTEDLSKKVDMIKHVIEKAKTYHGNGNGSGSGSMNICDVESTSSRKTSDSTHSKRKLSNTTTLSNATTMTNASPFSSCTSFVSTGESTASTQSSQEEIKHVKISREPKLFVNFCSGANYLQRNLWPSKVDKALRGHNIEDLFTKNCGTLVIDFADRDNWKLVKKLVNVNFPC